jgi:thioredoxin 1
LAVGRDHRNARQILTNSATAGEVAFAGGTHFIPPSTMSDKISQLTTDNFKATVSSSTAPLLVDFWAPWCGPCKAITPILEELAAEYGDKLKIAKVNIDDNNPLAVEFDVRAIPTMLLFKGGKLVDRLVGVMPKAALKAKIAPQLA